MAAPVPRIFTPLELAAFFFFFFLFFGSSNNIVTPYVVVIVTEPTLPVPTKLLSVKSKGLLPLPTGFQPHCIFLLLSSPAKSGLGSRIACGSSTGNSPNLSCGWSGFQHSGQAFTFVSRPLTIRFFNSLSL